MSWKISLSNFVSGLAGSFDKDASSPSLLSEKIATKNNQVKNTLVSSETADGVMMNLTRRLESNSNKTFSGSKFFNPAAGKRPPTEWEQKTLNKLDELAKANDGYFTESDLTKGLKNAKTEISKIIGTLKPGQTNRGVDIAAFAILNVDNERFKNDVSVEVTDRAGKKVAIAGGSGDKETFKCNIFIAAAHIEGGHLLFKNNGEKGAGFPLTNSVPPAANYLGDAQDRQKLSNLKIVADGSLKPGDIIAWRYTGGKSEGHSAIYIGGGAVVYSGSGDGYFTTGGAPKVMLLKDLDSNLRSSWIGQPSHEPYVVRRYSEN